MTDRPAATTPPRTRRVLVLNHFAVNRGGAGGTRHVELFDRLGDGWDYTLIAANRKNLTRNTKLRGSGNLVTVPSAPFSGNGPSRVVNWISYAFSAFAVGITRRNIDVVYGSSPHLLTALVAWKIAWIRRVPFVLEIRDLWPQVLLDMGKTTKSSVSYRLLRSLERFLYRQADEIVVLAKGTEAAIRSDVPDASISFVPNGSDLATWEVPDDRDELRATFGFSGLMAIYAGAHGPANGLDAVLDAAATNIDVTFLLIGDGANKQRLVDNARLSGLDNVVFLDPVRKAALARLFKASDVGLHVLADVPLFRYGVSPNKLFDYMAAGLPVVTNCPGEVAGLVIDADAGMACPPDGLPAAVTDIAEAGDVQRRAWGGNGMAFIEAERSREVVAAQLVAVLNRAVGQQS